MRIFKKIIIRTIFKFRKILKQKIKQMRCQHEWTPISQHLLCEKCDKIILD